MAMATHTFCLAVETKSLNASSPPDSPKVTLVGEWGILAFETVLVRVTKVVGLGNVPK